MGENKNFFEGPLFTITNYIMWLFIGNIYFALCNLPLIYILFLIPSAGSDFTNNFVSYIPIMFLCLIPIGPSITALLSVMGKLVREKDINLTKDYFKAYKANFKQSTLLWIFTLIVIVILSVDLYYFRTHSSNVVIRYLFLILIFIVIIMTLYTFPILSRFYMKSKDVIRLSYYYAIAKFKTTFVNILCVLFCFIAITKMRFFILFISTGICYLIMLNENKLLKEIEEKLESSDKKEEKKISEAEEVTEKIASDEDEDKDNEDNEDR
ncbi:MAG: DUF624 domain-containing protein [Bacillota bacterium]|nr:DUF624 domain-containing protein [Bacillota bacterium]